MQDPRANCRRLRERKAWHSPPDASILQPSAAHGISPFPFGRSQYCRTTRARPRAAGPPQAFRAGGGPTTRLLPTAIGLHPGLTRLVHHNGSIETRVPENLAEAHSLPLPHAALTSYARPLLAPTDTSRPKRRIADAGTQIDGGDSGAVATLQESLRAIPAAGPSPDDQISGRTFGARVPEVIS